MADNESKLSLENARRVAGLLRPLSPQARNDLLIAKRDGDFQAFQKVAFENRLDASSVWVGIDDLWQQSAQGVDIPLEDSGQYESQRTGEGRAGIAGAIAGGILLRREGSYENFQKDANEYAEFARKTWEKEEEKRLKDPKYKVPTGRAIDAQEAYDQAHRQYHEMLAKTDQNKAKQWLEKNPNNTSLALAVNKASLENKKLTYGEFVAIKDRHVRTVVEDWERRSASTRSRDRLTTVAQAHDELYDHLALNSPEAVRRWAKEYNDPELYAALERKRQRDIAQAKEDQGIISRKLGRDPSAKFGDKIEMPASTSASRISEAEKILGTNLSGYQKRALLDAHNIGLGEKGKDGNPAGVNNYTQEQVSQKARALKQAGFDKDQRRKLMESGIAGHENPAKPKRQGLRSRISNSKFGQKIKNSKIGRASARLNKMANGTSRATRKIKNLLNPLNYLLNLLKRSVIGSLINAAAAAITTILSTVVSVTVGTVTAVVGVFSAAVGAVMGSIGLPLVIIIVLVALLFIVFAFSTTCIVFCDQETREFIDSPYPGIAYSITAPETIQNGQNITYSILILFDETKATNSINDLVAFSKIPPGTSFVSATGSYNLSGSDISWKLYPDNKPPDYENHAIHTFAFTLTVKPVDDIIVENVLSFNASPNSPPPLPGNTAYNDNTCNGKYKYIKDNDLLPYNFGDPDCTLDTFAKRDNLYNLLKQKDPKWADFWFNVIIPGESGYRPNAWYLCGSNPWTADDPRCTPNPRGAWGLFQMGSSRPPGDSQRRIGGRGDVTWQEQIDNAVQRNRGNELLGLLFRYWQVAIEWCRDGNMNKPQCKDM